MSRNFYEVTLDKVGLIKPWYLEITMPNGYKILDNTWTKRGAKRKANNLLISIIDHPAKGAKK